MNKKSFVNIILPAILLLSLLASCNLNEKSNIVIGVLDGPSAVSFVQMMDQMPYIDGKKVEYVVESDPQKILDLMKHKKLDFAILPTVTAVNAYNKGIKYRMAPATEKAPKSISKGAAKEVITQNNAEAAAIVAAQKKKDKEMKEAAENARIEKERVAAEQRRKEQRAIDNAKNVMNGAFSKNTQGTGGPGNGGNGIGNGSGNGTGNTHQGNPAGKGISNGNSWSLNGRGLMGKLAQPAYNKDISGKVTIDIRVDANGKVISTSIGKPTNISDAQILQSARNAAINTRFTAGKSEAVGSITYNFNLN